MMNDYVKMIISQKYSDIEILRAFYFGLPEKSGDGLVESICVKADSTLLNIIKNKNIDELIDILGFASEDEKLINASNIPQYSSLDSINGVLDIIDANPGSSYADIGYYFNKDGNRTSWCKYGENHYKLTSYLGLVTTIGDKILTHFGKAYMLLPDDVKKEIQIKLFLRVLIVRMIMVKGRKEMLDVSKIMTNFLSESTMLRRRPNVKRMVMMITELSKYKGDYLKNTIWK